MCCLKKKAQEGILVNSPAKNVRVKKKANKRGCFYIIFVSGGRPAIFGKPCPHLSNIVNSRGETDLFPCFNLNIWESY